MTRRSPLSAIQRRLAVAAHLARILGVEADRTLSALKHLEARGLIEFVD